jgi:hypothetical protein
MNMQQRIVEEAIGVIRAKAALDKAATEYAQAVAKRDGLSKGKIKRRV